MAMPDSSGIVTINRTEYEILYFFASLFPLAFMIFPSDNPKYTICVSMDKTGMPIAGKLISNTVNKLAEYLNKH